MTPEQRSHNMSRIRGKDTSPELTLRKALWQRGHRYRIHYRLPGKPDITFISQRLAIFVDGCFWHGCPVHAVKPKTNAKFWNEKLGRNQDRDRKVTVELQDMGWQVFRFWEHEIEDDLESVIISVETALIS